MTEPAAGAGAARQIGEVVIGPEGVLTQELGTVTGSMHLATQLAAGRLRAFVQRAGDERWHEVAGSPLPVPEPVEQSEQALLHLHLAVHEAVIRHARLGGLPDGLVPEMLDEVGLG
ncbi:hypothetical protein Ppa06_64860 [Planomonospora parontospora subsp. parontospora]|uniref:Uncharacterized protein n=2 Tax=Planomonospora parontospora TaxID=58119 RepID=A0AA37F7P2_9ACTN|nr:hypothetical protein [Planomonospora parontospora]GGK94387.1 hypothetical protein GCM10010126_62320 [Planomonospora parontospora]GII12688.1 hypothetical protein Ppa06_64860 [Planomonospora parontospora subsp. parontospora]